MERKKIDPDNFCYYPFMQLLLQPTGVVSPCCWNQEITLGKVPESDLSEIWNGPRIRELRREFLEGNPKMCESQIRNIRCHLWSGRDYSHRLSLDEVQKGGPKRLDVRLNGKCNLQCVMCDVWKQPNGLYEQSDFWNKGPTEIFPSLLELDVLGGEPFVQSDTFRLIDEVSAVNPGCTWAFVTNGNYKFSDPIVRRLDKIKIRWMQVSLDSLREETYRKIRLGGDLQKAIRTLDGILAYQKEREKIGRGFRVLITMCVQKLNWAEVGEFVGYAKKCGIELVLQFAFQPDTVSLLSLSNDELVPVEKYFSSLSGEFGEQILHAVLQPVRDRLGA
ncbi:MAG: SPASM domain-containing protein [Oligoflexia bacterium]|nr:SPASM domain-containing protein [Oligoflexia bacterium]